MGCGCNQVSFFEKGVRDVEYSSSKHCVGSCCRGDVGGFKPRLGKPASSVEPCQKRNESVGFRCARQRRPSGFGRPASGGPLSPTRPHGAVLPAVDSGSEGTLQDSLQALRAANKDARLAGCEQGQTRVRTHAYQVHWCFSRRSEEKYDAINSISGGFGADCWLELVEWV